MKNKIIFAFAAAMTFANIEKTQAANEYPMTIDEKFVEVDSSRQYANFVLRFQYVLETNEVEILTIRKTGDGLNACTIPLRDDGGSAFYDSWSKNAKLIPTSYTGSLANKIPALRDNIDKQIWGKDKNFSGGGSYARRPGMWNFVELKAIRDDVEFYLNGYLVARGKIDGLSKLGTIVFSGDAENFKVSNMRIHELSENATFDELDKSMKMECPQGFTTYFNGNPVDLAMWKGVTTDEGFDNPAVRASAPDWKKKEKQILADAGMRAHWYIRNTNLFFDGYKGGYSLATAKDYKDFEMWADWRLISVIGDSGIYLRGSPQVQIWDAHNFKHIGSGGLFNNMINASKPPMIADKQIGDWNRFHIIMRGEKVTVYLNGELVVDNVTLENYWDRKRAIFEKEQIELQCHGDPTEWRNIFIKEL